MRELVADPGYVAGQPVPLRHGVADLVADACAARITVVILSNDLPRDALEHHLVLRRVHHVVSLANAAIRKPDRRAFQRALLVAGATADRALVVDDAPTNVAGARAADIAAILFDVTDPAASLLAVREALGLTAR